TPPTAAITHLFFFSEPSPTEIYTLSLHDALPICRNGCALSPGASKRITAQLHHRRAAPAHSREWRACAYHAAPGTSFGSRRCSRSEEHTSELQSRSDLVCRLLLEKKKKMNC